MTDTDTFQRIGPTRPGRALPVTNEQIEANLAQAARFPGEWCRIAVLTNPNSVGPRVARLRAAHPNIEFSKHGVEIHACHPQSKEG